MHTLTPSDTPGRHPSGLVPAFLVALALHAVVLVGVMYYRLTPPAPPGEQQISIDLSPLMTDAPTQAPAEQQMSQDSPPEAKPVDEPTEEPVKPPPPAETAEVKPEETEAVTPQTQAVIEPDSPVIISTAERAEPLAPPPPEVAQVPEEKPVAPERPKPDLAKLKAEREARLKKVREEAREERLEAIREAKAKAARAAKAKQAKAQEGAAARNSAAASRQSSAGRAAAGNDPSALRQWYGAISSAIHGRMNSSAAVGTDGGTATVRFTVLRSGQVAGAGVARSSGIGQIDSAALSAVRGSLPSAPAGVTQPSVSITIPLNFRVR